MDYEKKYNEALNLAKSYYGKGCNEFLDTIFPELAESEDEQIRKELIAILKKSYSSGITLNNKKDLDRYLAYLERQKEPENVSATTMAPSCWEVEQKEQKPLITGNDFGWIDELKHDLKHPEELDEKVQEVLKKRQKPTERSLEDDHIIGFIYDLLNEIEWKDNWAMSKEECLRLLNNYSPQKPTEWSEEDEKMRGTCIDLLEHFPRPCGEVIGPWKDCIAWLKSLRPQPRLSKEDFIKFGNLEYERGFKDGERSHWKPSEEQIYSLGTVVKGAGENNVGSVGYNLKELYEQLKKL